VEVQHEEAGLCRRARRLRRSLSPYRVFAVDLDGTLLTQQGEPARTDLETLAHLREAGVAVSIITGRLFSGTTKTAQLAGILGAVACADGAHIVEAHSGNDLLHTGILGEAAEALRAALHAHRAPAFLFAHDEVVHDDAGLSFLPYVKLWSNRFSHHQKVVDHPHWQSSRGLSEVVCVGGKSCIFATADAIEASSRGALSVAKFPLARLAMIDGEEPYGMVVRSSACSKGTAVEWLAKHHGVTAAEVVVVGDWLNDLPMFAVAGRSFAMGQAHETLKEAATDVLEATSATGGGVTEAARRAGLLR
jgi:hydroxymethylpyrimidine pyrophosphatase-like HAD family hydrolase